MLPQHLLLTALCTPLALAVGAAAAAFVGSSFSTRVRPSGQNNIQSYSPRDMLDNVSRIGTSLNYVRRSTRDKHEILELAKMREAELVEQMLSKSLEEARLTHHSSKRSKSSILFPSVRQCNSAIATFGDSGDFRRALRIFTEMRKSVSIIRRMSRSGNLFSQVAMNDEAMLSRDRERQSSVEDNLQSQNIDLVEDPPAPTLVTYSTLISRAVSVGKPRVAIRLWNLMKNQPTFFTNVISRKQRQGRISDATVFMDPAELHKLEQEHDAIVPDVIFCNTLMNAYAKLGDHKMARFILNSMLGSSKDVVMQIPKVTPTIVTYNTLADACKEAGDLAAGLDVLELMSCHAQLTGDKNIAPDARTYTILISTVARKTKHDQETRDVRSGGERDPDKAFDLLNEMQEKGIKPNGVTYCALIDVCGRCRRYDLALNGLRIMLQAKKATNTTKPLINEVGAWTAAITACGKNGRIDTALRLFEAMQRFSVKPNVVTCGSLTDSLLKAGKIDETIEVLQYMKREGLVPGEVMYTSLMSSALGIAQRENDEILTVDGVKVKVIDKLLSSDRELADDRNKTNSILLYTELMRSMVRDGRDTTREDVLLKVFLTFQEMKTAGVVPDLACYNSLLRACSFAGDADKAQDVLRRINEDGLEPNHSSYREALKAAAREGRSDIADFVWNEAVTRKRSTYEVGFNPRASDFELLVSSYWSEVQKTTNHTLRIDFHRKIIDLFEGVQLRSTERGLHLISLEEVEQNQLLVLTVLRAAVSVVLIPRKGEIDIQDEVVRERIRARGLACDIAGLDVLQGDLLPDVDGKTKKALNLARNWLYSY